MTSMTHTHTHTDPPLGGSMRVAWNDYDDRAGLRDYVQFNKYTHTLTQTQTHSEWHRMTRMTGPDYAVMCNLINTHAHTHTHTHTRV